MFLKISCRIISTRTEQAEEKNQQDQQLIAELGLETDDLWVMILTSFTTDTRLHKYFSVMLAAGEKYWLEQQRWEGAEAVWTFLCRVHTLQTR